MSKEAMKLALEALENSVDLVREDAYQAERLYGNYPTRQGKINGLKVLADDHEKAITALREALAEQPAQQEPVAMWDGKYQIEFGNLSAYKHGEHSWIPLYTSPPPQRTWVGLTDDFLQQSDYHLLHRFIETTEDDEGYDIGKEAVKRLAELGVVQSHGFGKYSVTMFGYWVHERYWEQNPSLPLKTNADRAIEAAHGIGEKK